MNRRHDEIGLVLKGALRGAQITFCVARHFGA